MTVLESKKILMVTPWGHWDAPPLDTQEILRNTLYVLKKKKDEKNEQTTRLNSKHLLLPSGRFFHGKKIKQLGSGSVYLDRKKKASSK